MFPLVETIKILNGKALNLQYHQKRFDYSFESYFKKKPFCTLQNAISVPEEFTGGVVKLRLLYGKDDYKLEFSCYRPHRTHTLKLIENNEIDYSLKFTDRSQINSLLKQREDCDDILIVKNGFISDTSIANIVFHNGHEWVTPATPLLKGTCREKLLNEGKIKEEVITIDDLFKFRSFSLINAMNCGDFVPIPIENIK